MRSSLTATFLPVFLLLASFASSGCADGDQEVSPVQADVAAADWVSSHDDGWTVEDGPRQGERLPPPPVPEPCRDGRLQVHHRTAAAELVLSFDCPDGEVADLAWMKAHLRGYELRRLTIALDVPGWTFEGRPSRCVLTDGLTFEDWTDGSLSLHVEAQLFEVAGRRASPECRIAYPVPEGPTPDECFVSVPYQRPVVLALTVPLSPATFGRDP